MISYKSFYKICLTAISLSLAAFTFAQTTNLALNKPATQSTTNNNGASKATDGDDNTYSETNWEGTDLIGTAWIQVDLQNNYDLSIINIIANEYVQVSPMENFLVIISPNEIPGIDLSQKPIADMDPYATQIKEKIGPRSGTYSVDLENKIGRYVRIQTRKGGQPLRIKEINIMGGPNPISGAPPAKLLWPVNLAAGKTAVQSTTEGDNTANKAVDTDNNSYSKTNWTTAPWWQVDLGNRYSISEIKLAIGWENELKDFFVIFSDNPFPDVVLDYEISVLEQHAVKAIQVNQGISSSFGVPVSPAVTARYVRIQRRTAAGDKPLELKNISIMGAPDPISGAPTAKLPWPVNLAAGKVAAQSTTEGDHTANKAVDADNNSFSQTKWFATAPWWQVDLGNRYSIPEIKLAIGWENELKDFFVIFSDNPFPDVALDYDISVLEKYAVKAIRITQGITANFQVPVSPAVTARYVRIQRRTAAGDKPLELKNISMMGAPNPISGSGPTKQPWADLFTGGTPYDPSIGDSNLQGMGGEYFHTQKTSPKIVAHPNGDGSFDVAWQDMTIGSKKIFISRYNQSGGNYMKDAGNSKSMDGLGFLAGFTKGGGHQYVMTGEPWSDRNEMKQVKVFKDNNVLWVGKKDNSGCKDINAMLMGGSARLTLAGTKLMAEFNTGPTHPYQVILDVNSTDQNAGKCSYQKAYQHCFDNEILFDGTDFVVMEKLDHDIGIGMMKFSPSATGPFNYQLRSVYAHTNFGNGTFIEFGDFQPGLNGGYLLLFASERDWDYKMTGYFHYQPWAPEVLSPLDIALVHVKNDFDQQELNWKNKAGTGPSQAPAVVDNSNMVNSNGSGKTVTYPSANDGWGWQTYNQTVYNEINAVMPTRQQITSGVKWLTTYGVPYETGKRKGNPGEQFTCVRFPKLVNISSTEYIALWEEHYAEIGNKSKAYITTKATKITLSANGSKVDIINGTIKDIGQVRLMADDDAFELSGKAAWIIGNKNALNLKLYTLDGNLNLSTYDLGL